MKYKFLFAVFSCFLHESFAQQNAAPIYYNNRFAIYADSIVQDKRFTAKALSTIEIASNYKSPSKEFPTTKVKFKFTLNGSIIEMKAFSDHHFNISKDNDETPIIKFGEELIDTTTAETPLKPDSKLKIRVDLSPVLNDFKTKGFYVSYDHDTLFAKDFKAVYVGGETLPMSWNFAQLYTIPQLELKDDDKDGIYETVVSFNPSNSLARKFNKDVTAFPQYRSSHSILNAVYNLALEEMINAVEKDSTFRTGIDWPGVWTRDISYSIILSMATLQPKVAMNSLMKKVTKKKRIIQDTGTGGSYPVSSDRMIWAVAAWEVYKVTGDKDWLQQIYPIIKNSVEDDMQNVYDAATGLVRGESSFLDWGNTQTYPKWMQPLDVYSSLNLGTNVVHYQANNVLAQMAILLSKNKDAKKYNANAAKIKAAVNKYLWMANKKYYGQYLYGRNYKIISPKAEALGEALAVIFDVANEAQQKMLVANTPVTDFGITCIFPQIPDVFAYHNNAVWPFVQSYWTMAAAKSGNEKAVLASMAAVWRPAALFLTNKENFVAQDGDYNGTAINSSNMLWSLAGNLSLVHKVLFGIEYAADKLLFHPFVPKALQDTRILNNFPYRNSILNITLVGYGNRIKSFLLDGKLLSKNEIPASLKGTHSIKILLDNVDMIAAPVNNVGNDFAPATPIVNFKNDSLAWSTITGDIAYDIYKNGNKIVTTKQHALVVTDKGYSEYQVVAIDAKHYESFASEPLEVADKKRAVTYEAESFTPVSSLPYKGFSGAGFIETSKTINATIAFNITIPEAGYYAINFRYANGNGDLGQENKAAIRTLLLNNKKCETIVFPQRGKDVWNNWGFSNAAKIYLPKGKQQFNLTFEPVNENMNIVINQAMIDYIRITKLD